MHDHDAVDLFAIPDFHIPPKRLADSSLCSPFFAPGLATANPDQTRHIPTGSWAGSWRPDAAPTTTLPPASPPVLPPAGVGGFFSWKALDAKPPPTRRGSPVSRVAEPVNPPKNKPEDHGQPGTNGAVVRPPANPKSATRQAPGLRPLDDVWITESQSMPHLPVRPGLLLWSSSPPRPDTPQSVPLFMAEAGPRAYDAWMGQNLRHGQNLPPPPVDATVYCAALLSLALGRESVFFRRPDQQSWPEPVLDRVRLTGYSAEVLEGLQDRCIRTSRMFLAVRSFIQAAFASPKPQCHVSLASVLDRVLSLVQEIAAQYDDRILGSVLRLQSLIHKIHALLSVLDDLVSRLPVPASDEQILDLVFARAGSADYGRGHIQTMMQEILQQVSRPWLDFAEQWIGTRPEECGSQLSQASVGGRKHFVAVVSDMQMTDSGLDAEVADFQLDRDKVPAFIPSDVAGRLFETGRNLRFIRTRHPEHSLSTTDLRTLKPPTLKWHFQWEPVLELEQDVAAYQQALMGAVYPDSHVPACHPAARIAPTLAAPEAPPPRWQIFGMDPSEMKALIVASMKHFDSPIKPAGAEGGDLLSLSVREHFADHEAEDPSTASTSLDPHWSLLPMLSFDPIIAAQARVISLESLRLLFDAHHLRAHLRLLRAFYLLGSSTFSSRLAEALFGSDTETWPERGSAAALPAAAGAGLRLSSRDVWPPAGSELRLALIGILRDSYEVLCQRPGHRQPARHRADVSRDIPGDLNFAVRELDPDEMRRCLDSNSLEALDFLRLEYKAPVSMVAVITSENVDKFDRIFKQLLRVLRMIHAVGQLSRDVTSRFTRWVDPDMASVRLSTEAGHFVRSIGRYFFDVGISAAWATFESRLDQVQAKMRCLRESEKGDGLSGWAYGPDRIRDDLGSVLDQILFSLFLKKKQHPVLELLEEIFRIILQFSRHARSRARGRQPPQGAPADCAELYRGFRKKVHLFIAVCRGMAEEGESGRGPGKQGRYRGERQSTAVPTGHLVTMLDLAGYYGKEWQF